MKIPISLIVDDPAPIISVHHEHAKNPFTTDGRPLVPTFPNEALFEFCDIVEEFGIKGKFSIVPMPGNKGDIVNGIDGVDKKELDEWIETVKKRLVPNFSICPEMLTHNKAVELKTGNALPMNEQEWSNEQNRETLVPYITKALSLLKKAGFELNGVSSPWCFGEKVLDEYEYSISKSVFDVFKRDYAWYFLHMRSVNPSAKKPWVALEEDARVLVSIPATVNDFIWQTINNTRNDNEYISDIADKIITVDGKNGEIIDVINNGGYPILLTHWQSLNSNGLRTGMKVLKEVCRRVQMHLSSKVQWKSFEEITKMVFENKKDYPNPIKTK